MWEGSDKNFLGKDLRQKYKAYLELDQTNKWQTKGKLFKTLTSDK